jgi:hypothetical protein
LNFFYSKILKDRYYVVQREKIKLEKQMAKKLYESERNGQEITLKNTYLYKLDLTYQRHFYRNKILNSIILKDPSIVFDFRYNYSYEKNYLLSSLYRQYAEIIRINRQSVHPLQIHFCNLNKDNLFYNAYGKELGLKENMVHMTDKRYIFRFFSSKIK